MDDSRQEGEFVGVDEGAAHEGQTGFLDDFLAGGRTAASLGEIAEEAGCEVVGAIFIIEKTFSGGRELLESHGWDVHALVGITSLEGGGVEIAG